MSDVRVCVTGCTSLGRHLSHCDSPDDQCRGCMPREAVDGLLCARCWGNLQRDVRTAPSIVDWIREHVIPSGQQALMQESTVKVRGPRVDSEGPLYIGLASPGASFEGQEPLSAVAVDDADELHAQLASWALLILEQHPSNLVGPRVIRQRRSDDGTVVGLLPRYAPDDAEPDRAAPKHGSTGPRPPSTLTRQPGARCPLSDLLVTQCACMIHQEDQ